MTEKRFELKVNQHNLCDIVDWVESKEKKAICIYNDLGDYYFSSAKALCDLLNELHEQIERLKRNFKALDEVKCELAEENERLKQTISKIDFAIIRKYDNSLENLLDEVYDGEYNNWIQKQLLRAKKLNGDLE